MRAEAWPPVAALAMAVRTGRKSAAEQVGEALARIAAGNGRINAVTRVLEARARAEAALVDAQVAAGVDPGPLAGVPFGVKDLFDVAGLPTTAGAGMRRTVLAAERDAEAVCRLRQAGAILVAMLNMDEYAYGFATVNATWGTTRNPHAIDRLAGGSSGGSAAAVAAGMLPFTLGSDTNGSVRGPASLCGTWGLKPTHGALPMDGVFPFADNLDDIGAFTRSAGDLRLVTSVLAGASFPPPFAAPRVAMLGGWFAANLTDEMRGAMAELVEALGNPPVVEIPAVDKARSAAFLITAAEGGALHLSTLRRNALDYDPATRDRLIAGAALPAAACHDARAFQARFKAGLAALFANHDVLIAPATIGTAPPIDAPMIALDGRRVPARANLGLFTQPLSLAGVPVVAAPLARGAGLPLGIQIVGAPGTEARLFAFAEALERRGLLACPAVADCFDAG